MYRVVFTAVALLVAVWSAEATRFQYFNMSGGNAWLLQGTNRYRLADSTRRGEFVSVSSESSIVVTNNPANGNNPPIGLTLTDTNYAGVLIATVNGNDALQAWVVPYVSGMFVATNVEIGIADVLPWFWAGVAAALSMWPVAWGFRLFRAAANPGAEDPGA